MPRPISTWEIHPASITTAAPNTHGRIEIQPASACENPRPLMMNGVNQVSPSDSAQDHAADQQRGESDGADHWKLRQRPYQRERQQHPPRRDPVDDETNDDGCD